jgi:hypothetical protein
MMAVRKSEIREAAAMLRAIVDRIQWGELTAPGRVVARLEGALSALEALTGPGRQGGRPRDN